MTRLDTRTPLGPVRLIEPYDVIPITLAVAVWVWLPAPVESTPHDVLPAARAARPTSTVPQEAPPMNDVTTTAATRTPAAPAVAPPPSHAHDAAALRSLVARLAALRDARDAPGEALALAAAAAGGWDPDALAELMLERGLGADRRAEVAAALDRYRVLLGHESPDGAVERVLRIEAARGGGA